MALTRDSLNSIPTSFATCSIGCSPDHSLAKKLSAISSAGFTGIELSMPDLLSFASQHLRHEVGPYEYEDLAAAAKVVKAMAGAQGLTIMMMQPFSNFEGWREGSDEGKDAWTRVEGWTKIMEACGCDMLQVGSTDTPIEKLDTSKIVPDLRCLADHLNGHNMRLAYENWCWSSHAPDWRDVWNIIHEVDRPNAGLCLDTFQSAGGEFADPTTRSGLLEKIDGRRVDVGEVEKRWKQSCEDLAKTVPAEKIYLLQISDAYKPPRPLGSLPDGTRPRGNWSHAYRPLPYDGGYLPVEDFTKAVLKTGFRGWFSTEVFDMGPDGSGSKKYELADYASRAMDAHRKLMRQCADERDDEIFKFGVT